MMVLMILHTIFVVAEALIVFHLCFVKIFIQIYDYGIDYGIHYSIHYGIHYGICEFALHSNESLSLCFT